MAKCIFCKSTTNLFTTREHILPESLGGQDWAILKSGLFCNSCQNKFGSEVEQQALADYPFILLRTFLGIPTKKRKPPWFESFEGKFYATPTPGTIEYEPATYFEKSTINGTKSAFLIPATPLRPDMLCRFLVKMGIEVVAHKDENLAFNNKLDEARNFALTGKKQNQWWCLQRENMEEAQHYIQNGVTSEEWFNNVKLEIIPEEYGHLLFHFKILYLDMIVPLTQVFTLDYDNSEEPTVRVFRA